MALFNNHYDRPGPGVNKDEPKKKPFFHFWELVFRKFWDLIKLNLLFCIPVLVVGVLAYFLGKSTGNSLVSMIPIILLFPFIAGLTMVTRNYAREEHAFIFSDFKEAVEKNWKLFLANGVVCFAVYWILSVAITYYSAQVNTSWFFFIPLALSVAIAVLFIFAQYYFPVMAITFDLKLKDIYKNSFIFSIVGLWRNLLITVILAVLGVGVYLLTFLSPLTLTIALVLVVFLLFSFSMFLINFTVYPLIDRIMIQPYQKKEDSESPSDFSDR